MTYIPLAATLCLPLGLTLLSAMRVIAGDPDDAWSPYHRTTRPIERE